MDETLRDDIPQVSKEENEVLTARFIEEEIKKQFLIWNITRLLVRMVFPLNFITSFGK